MEDETKYVRNTDGCDVHFNEKEEELIPVNLMLTKKQLDIIICKLLITGKYRSKADKAAYKEIVLLLEKCQP